MAWLSPSYPVGAFSYSGGLEWAFEAGDVTDAASMDATFDTIAKEWGSLDFVVRAYLPNLDNRLEVIHQLHTAIDQEFRAAGIEIAFPQRDVHIRSMPAGAEGREERGEG